MRVSYVDADEADDHVRHLLDADAEQYGSPSLFALALANNPTVLEARMHYTTALREATPLDAEEIELVYAAVASERSCPYCTSSHTEQLIDRFGMDGDRLETNLEEVSFDNDRQQALVEVATAVAADPKRTGDAIEGLREIGFDDDDIVALVVLIAAATSATTIADALNILPQDNPNQSTP